MPPRKRTPQPNDQPISDYRHGEKRKNIPPAGLAAQGKVQDAPRTRYAYDPHLPPVLRFDESGAADCLPELLEAARQRPLSDAEAGLLAQALRREQPWLEWSGKREKRWFEVDPVALHIHERVSAQAILKLAARQPIQRSLFADPEMEYRQAVQFYQHDVDWTNRLILGDSLVVMNSLARREDLAGKVQMIYLDPPYGIKFASNFQAQVGKRDVKDKEADLTREQEQVKAYRDTWTLGIHSYLTYLRDRLFIARELLLESGCLFLQINSENSHHVANLLDEVFGKENFVANIVFRKKSLPLGAKHLETMHDHLLFYAKDKTQLKYRHIYDFNDVSQISSHGPYCQHPDGNWMKIDPREFRSPSHPLSTLYYRLFSLIAPSYSRSTDFEYEFEGKFYSPPSKGAWVVNAGKLERLRLCNRLQVEGKSLSYKLYYDDFPYKKVTNFWLETAMSYEKIFVVQTTPHIIARCILMTTDPGDLVLDPTCGSGTTAYVAEQWGRRWITIDTSRVAVALARQRLLTAKYDYYELRDPGSGPHGGFHYKTVPHITLKSIAQNQALDPIFARWGPVLAQKLAALNRALGQVTPEARRRLQAKLAEKERREGKSSLSEADRRRWVLPPSPPAPLPQAGEGGFGWREWEVPFDTDPDWPAALQEALLDYRKAWRGKMDEVNAAIAASAPQEELVDQPRVKAGVLRVSGPFTVEGVQPVEDSLDLEGSSPINGAPEALDTFSEPPAVQDEPANAGAFLDKMIRLLRADGVRFPNNKVMQFGRLDPLNHPVLHAEGEWAAVNSSLAAGEEPGGEGRRAAVRFGPQYGAITAQMVEEAIWAASRGGYDDLVLAGFAIDGAAQAVIQDDPNPRVRCHAAHIRPDVNMGDLLKDTPSSQLFTVFGLPRVELSQQKGGEWVVEMQGVDIYDPVENTIQSTGAGKVAAWFLDSDYDGQTFCVSQAFFPDSTAWDKLARALKTVVDPERFEAFSGTVSLPFPYGKHNRIAVKVIDPRGNEVMRVMGAGQYGD